MITIDYNNIELIKSVKSINEDKLQQAISLTNVDSCSDILSNTSQQLASSSDEKALNISNRLQIYLATLSTNIANYETVASELKNVLTATEQTLTDKNTSQVPLSSNQFFLNAFFQTNIQQTQLVVDAEKGHLLKKKYGELTTFFKNSVTKNFICRSSATEKSSMTYDTLLCSVFYKTDICFDKSDPALKFFYEYKSNATIADIDIITTELDLFVDYLESLRVLQANIVIGYNELSTTLSALSQFPPEQACGFAPYAQKAQLDIGSWNKSDINQDILVESLKNVKIDNIYALSSIKIPNLVRIRQAVERQSQTKQFVLSQNGMFSFNIEVVDNAKSLSAIKEQYKEKYKLGFGEIISRKNILLAIDHIFNYWLQNISCLILNITICHSNCHYNYVRLSEMKSDQNGHLELKTLFTIYS